MEKLNVPGITFSNGVISFSQHWIDNKKNELKLNSNASFDEVINTLSEIVNPKKQEQILTDEINKCKLRIAICDINDYIRKGIIDVKDKDHYVKMATINTEIALNIASEKYSQKIELNELLNLSARELYLTGKFQRLKEIDYGTFLLKYKEFFGVGYNEAAKA